MAYADVGERHEQAQDVAIGHGDDLVRKAVRQPREPEGEGLPEQRPREHRTEQLRVARREHGGDHDRDEDVGHDDAEHAHAESDHEPQPDDQGGERAREAQRGESSASPFDAHYMEGDEREAHHEDVDERQLEDERVARHPEQPLGEPRREAEGGQQHDESRGREEQEDGAREPLARARVRAVEEQPHERRVEAEAKDDLGHGLDAEQQADDPVVGGREVADVDREEQEADEVRRDVAEAVHGEVADEAGQACHECRGIRTGSR